LEIAFNFAVGGIPFLQSSASHVTALIRGSADSA
jgi:hypothetical protein